MQLGFAPLISEAVLHLDADRAAERVETEHRIAGPHVDAVNGAGRDQVPVHGVAEGFVDAHAVLVDGNALRRALQRRGGKSAKAQILNEAVALDIRQIDPGTRCDSASVIESE